MDERFAGKREREITNTLLAATIVAANGRVECGRPDRTNEPIVPPVQSRADEECPDVALFAEQLLVRASLYGERKTSSRIPQTEIRGDADRANAERS